MTMYNYNKRWNDHSPDQFIPTTKGIVTTTHISYSTHAANKGKSDIWMYTTRNNGTLECNKIYNWCSDKQVVLSMIIICINLFSAMKGTHIYTTITLQFPFNCRRHNLILNVITILEPSNHAKWSSSARLVMGTSYKTYLGNKRGARVDQALHSGDPTQLPTILLLFIHVLWHKVGGSKQRTSVPIKSSNVGPNYRPRRNDHHIRKFPAASDRESRRKRSIELRCKWEFSSHQSTSKGIRAHPSTFHSLFI